MKNTSEVVNFTKHLSVMIKSGIPIGEALESLIGQYQKGSFKSALSDILKEVSQGKSLASSLTKHPRFFDQYYISLVDVGEKSGNLESNLDYLANQLTKDLATRKKFAGSLLYPGFVLAAAFLIGGGISIFVLPKLVDFFGAFDIPLPLPTRILLSFSTLMKNDGIFILGGIVALAVIFYLLSRVGVIKNIWDRILIRLPFLGIIFSQYQITRLCRNLGTQLKSGVPISEALDVTAKSLSNKEFSDDLIKIRGEIAQGKNLYDVMQEFPVFPPLLLKMIQVGEKSGKLDESFLYMAEYYDNALDEITKNLGTIIEPVLLIIIGLIVGFIAIAIITPIYQLTGSINPGV